MAIGTAMAIGLAASAAASAGSQVYAAKQAGKASKQAAKVQSEAADRSRKVYDDHLLPWVNKGRETASTLARLTSAPAGSRFAGADTTMGPQGAPGGPPPGARPRGTIGGMVGGMAGAGGEMARRVAGSARKGGGPRGTIGGMVEPQGEMPGGPGGGPQMGGAPSLVTLRAPDGSTGQVPEHMAELYIRQGAQRVS